MDYKNRIAPLLLGICLFVIPLILFLIGAFDASELVVFDLLSRSNTEPGVASDRISLILIDTKTLEWGLDYYERFDTISGVEEDPPVGYGIASRYIWPWKREVYERIINFLARGGARVVAFDMDFSSPHPSGDRQSDLTLGYSGLLQNEEGKTFVIHTLNFRASEDPPQDLLTDLEQNCLRAASIPVEGGEDSNLPLDRSGQGRFFDPILPYRDIVEDAVLASEETKGILRLGTVTAQIDPDSVIRRARVL
ncbi:MAG: CHASE2 domain-containing protein, partial [Planctomycetes bacterium]|nr:CHASE2 domain-containing protein [Planctomycetota bacterium]